MIYKKILSQSKDRYIMPSFHYNIGLSLLALQKNKAAKDHLQQAASLETKRLRKEQILNATF